MSRPSVFVFLLIALRSDRATGFASELANCHDNFELNPPDGILPRYSFSWLGFAQYTHVTTGLPHHSKAPRVVLIQRQFVVGTAADMINLPKNYKLGNIIFGEYEQEERDCGLTHTQLKMGGHCPHAYIEIPVLDITPHPEYSRFGVGNSLALVKLLRPMKSNYMVPVCMPSLTERTKKKKNRAVFMIDYLSMVPRDFDTEKMGKKTMRLFTHKECRRHRLKWKLGSEGVTHVLCTSGCGVRPGAPIITHNTEGAFELIGLAAGSGPCTRKSQRRHLIKEPPLYIDVYPYVTWMINVISAHEMPTAYPQNYKLVERVSRDGVHKDFLRKRKPQKSGWRGKVFVIGNYCYKTPKKQRRRYPFFYSEKFIVNTESPSKFTLKMKISAGYDCTIVCARLMVPNSLTVPVIDGVGGYNISVDFSSASFPYIFYYSLSLSGKNSTEADLAEWIWERDQGFW